MRIVIDPGHGGKDPGAVYRGEEYHPDRGPEEFDIYEADLNLVIALEVDEALARIASYGFKADKNSYLTRAQDRTLSLYVRAHKANKLNADCFVSIHCNAGALGARGWEIFHWPGSVEGQRLAERIEDGVVENGIIGEIWNRGIKEANFYVLRETKMPAVLVECGFGSDAHDLALLVDPDWQRKLGEAIAKGILAWVT